NPAPVLVDFHAKWNSAKYLEHIKAAITAILFSLLFFNSRCGPCKILGPRLENVMKSYMKSVLLAKVDVDHLDTIAEKYKINVVPTVISMKNGKEIERFEGAKEEEFIKRKIEFMLSSKAS
ncbi:unnamed protein product, partial [Trichobilharzia regenti]